MIKDLHIPTPSVTEVNSYLNIWNSTEKYALSESSLNKLFLKTYPLNNNLDEVVTKVCALDVVYSAHASFWFLSVAKHIVDCKIDKRIQEGELDIVDELADTTTLTGKKLYSFATKYCSHHNPKVYPIYDQYVEKILMYFKRKDKFMKFSQKDLKEFKKFRDILYGFKKYYCLEQFNLKDIDIYLWQAGKEAFSPWQKSNVDNRG